jgi:hypothetical protein
MTGYGEARKASTMKTYNRKLALLTETPHFNGLKWLEGKLFLTWSAETEVSNVLFWRILVFKLAWPPVVSLECFCDVEVELINVGK